LEWVKFESKSLASVANEFHRCGSTLPSNPAYVHLHLDHIPAIDEDNQKVDFIPIFKEALSAGYQSVMIDGSRLPFAENIQATRQVVELAHPLGVAVEAELGAVLGHETVDIPPYEELFVSGQGFTDVEQARIFVRETGCDWLSVAVGNIHGAIAAGRKDQKKVEARLNIDRIKQLQNAVHIPLVLHGGSGIQQVFLLEAMKHGISKINIATEIRQPYETKLRETNNLQLAQQTVYERTCRLLDEFLKIKGLRTRLSSLAGG
jgi:ketose-bisphosphate aldolase